MIFTSSRPSKVSHNCLNHSIVPIKVPSRKSVFLCVTTKALVVSNLSSKPFFEFRK